eukprot:11288038-Heterocapsa_arctica.AAC.1
MASVAASRVAAVVKVGRLARAVAALLGSSPICIKPQRAPAGLRVTILHVRRERLGSRVYRHGEGYSITFVMRHVVESLRARVHHGSCIIPIFRFLNHGIWLIPRELADSPDPSVTIVCGELVRVPRNEEFPQRLNCASC